MSAPGLVHATAASPAASAASGPTPQAREALRHLADIVVPPPVPWTPQTIGWALLAAVLAALLLWAVGSAVVSWRRNRYRRDALRELAQLDTQVADAAQRDAALRAVAPLVKRCALVAWPRGRTASLSGAAWVAFLGAHARGGLDPALQRLLIGAQYQAPGRLQDLDAGEARAVVAGARRWVRGHRVTREDRHVPA